MFHRAGEHPRSSAIITQRTIQAPKDLLLLADDLVSSLLLDSYSRMDESSSNKVLKQIYHALELRQFQKAYKLTFTKPQCEWPLVISLRAHSLERSGRLGESLCILRDLIHVLFPSSLVQWREEVNEKIWACGEWEEQTSISDSTNIVVSDMKLSTQSASLKKPNQGQKTNTTNRDDLEEKLQHDLNLIDVLDMPRWKRRQAFVQSQSSPGKLHHSPQMVIVGGTDAVIRETTVDTIALCLRNMHLYDTASKVYTMSCEIIEASTVLTPLEKKEILVWYLERVFHSSLVTAYEYEYPLHESEDAESTIQESTLIIQALERAQTASMQLVRHTGEKLYSYWAAQAILLHYDCVESVHSKLVVASSNLQDSLLHKDLKQKLLLKCNMLPRLAESMLKSHIKAMSMTWDDGSKLYVKALELQGKLNDIVSFLISARDYHFTVNDDDAPPSQDKTGSLSPSMSHTLEIWTMLAEIYGKMGQWEEAFNIYSQHLLPRMPDQWDYWVHLLECAMKCPASTNDALLKCADVVQKMLEKSDKLRAPHLFQLELELNRLKNGSYVNTEHQLCDSIIEYVHRFGGLHCCFEDVRKHVQALVHSCHAFDKSTEFTLRNPVLQLLNKAKDSWDDNNYTGSDSYICCYIKVSFEIWHQLSLYHTANIGIVDQVVTPFIPPLEKLLDKWQDYIDLTRTINDRDDGGYSIGDDFLLLAVQILIYRSCSPCNNNNRHTMLLLASALLETAIIHSPQNPYIKIAAVHLYSRFLGSARRAYELYLSLDIKQIQQESCSYIILVDLIKGVFYMECADVCWNILSLHVRSSKDVSDYASKACNVGNIIAGKEMFEWRRKMLNSLQLFEAKGLLLSSTLLSSGGLLRLAHETTSSEDKSSTASMESLDKSWAIKAIKEYDNMSSPSSLLNIESVFAPMSMNSKVDHRDFSINQFEILYRTGHSTQDEIYRLIRIRQLTHSLLTRMVLMEHTTKAPKKGKAQKLSKNDKVVGVSQSLLRFIALSEFHNSQVSIHVVECSFLTCLRCLARISCLVSSGQNQVQGNGPLVTIDDLSDREKCCVPLFESAGLQLKTSLDYMKSHHNYLMDNTSIILFDLVIPVFASLLTVEKVCSMFGFGRAKAHTKIGGQALCQFAFDLLIVIRFIHEKSKLPETFTPYILQEAIGNSSYASFLQYSLYEGEQLLDDVLDTVVHNRMITSARVQTICSQMINVLESFATQNNEIAREL